MAISFVAATGNATSSGGTSYTLLKPSGAATGDVIICAVVAGDNTGGVSLPTGWTQIGSTFSTTAGNDGDLLLGYRVVQDGDPASWTDGTVSSLHIVRCTVTSCYSGVDTTTPVLDHAGSWAANPGTHSSGTVNNTDSGAWALGVGAYIDNSATTFTRNSGDPTTLRDQLREFDGGEVAAVGLWDSDGAVATGSRSFAVSETGLTDAAFAAILLLQPTQAPSETGDAEAAPVSVTANSVTATLDSTPTPEAAEPQAAAQQSVPSIAAAAETASATVAASDVDAIKGATPDTAVVGVEAIQPGFTAVTLEGVGVQAFNAEAVSNFGTDAPAGVAEVAASAGDTASSLGVEPDPSDVTAGAESPAVGLTPDAASVAVSAPDAVAQTSTTATPDTAVCSAVAGDALGGVGGSPSSADSASQAADATATFGVEASTAAIAVEAYNPGVESQGQIDATPSTAIVSASAADGSVDAETLATAADSSVSADDAVAALDASSGDASIAAAAEDGAASSEALPGVASVAIAANDAAVSTSSDELAEDAGVLVSAADSEGALGPLAGSGAASVVADDASASPNALPGAAGTTATAYNASPLVEVAEVALGGVQALDAVALIGGSPGAATVNSQANDSSTDRSVLPSTPAGGVAANNATVSVAVSPDAATVLAVAYELSGPGLFSPAGLAMVSAVGGSPAALTGAAPAAALAVIDGWGPLASIDHGPPDFRALAILRELRIYNIEAEWEDRDRD